MVGDGFGGRLWYEPTNYTVGSYSGYSRCDYPCDDDVNELYGWGSNSTGQLGLGSTVSGVFTPTPIPNMTNVKYYSTGYIMGAIKNDATGWVWGDVITPIPSQVISDVYFVDAGWQTISFVKNDGTIWTLGSNYAGCFGDGPGGVFFSTVPVQMLNVNNAVRVAVNQYSTTVLLADGSLVSAGDNSGGWLGVGSAITQTNIPIVIPGLPNIVDIKSNATSTIALSENGEVFFWGLTNSSPTVHFDPYQIVELDSIIAISGCDDGYHYLALDENGNCYGFGDSFGQFGVSLVTNVGLTPVLVASNVIDIMAGETFSYIVKDDLSLWGAGSSNQGSIWLNLTNEFRDYWAKMEPNLVPGSCQISGVKPKYAGCLDTMNNEVIIDFNAGNLPYQYSLDGSQYQYSNVFRNLDNGQHEVEVINADGCEYAFEIEVDFIENCGLEGTIHFPNIFTPDSDGENDYFNFRDKGLDILDCKIFNRWGNLVNTIDDPQGNWDGTDLNNHECPEGVYYYIIEYSFNEVEFHSHSGYIHLIR